MGKRSRTTRRTDTARLRLSAAISLALHGVLAAVWMVYPSGLTSSDNQTRAKPAVHFGIDQSHHQTISWLGFIDPTPNQAPEGSVEQSALSPDAAVPAADEPPPPAKKPVAAQLIEASSAAQASIEQWVAQSQVVIFDLFEAIAELESAAAKAQAESDASEQSEQATKPAEEADPTESESEQEAAETVAEGSSKPAEVGPPAIESDKESDATSLEEPLEYRNGKVASREGLDIKTVKPKWSDATRLTSTPRNPLVRVEFASTGKVKRATFVGVGSGFEGVDHTLLNAVYAWTASGKEIEDLKKNDPDGVVEARIRFLLR